MKRARIVGKTVVLSVNSDNEQSYKISDLGGEQFRLEGNCDTPINFKSNGNPVAGITQYKIFDEGEEVAEYFREVNETLTTTTTRVTDLKNGRVRTLVDTDDTEESITLTDSKIPSENFTATYTNGVLTKVEKTAGGRPVVIDRALNGSVITETTKLDDSVIATRTITYLSPEEIQVQIEEVVTTVKLDPGNGWSVKETNSPFGTGSFSAVAEDFSFDSLFKPGGLDAGKIETSVTTNPGGGLKESEVKRDDAKIASAEGANHDPASDRPTKVTFEDGTTRQNNIKQGVSTGGTDEAGRKSSVDISGTGKINSLVIDDIDLTPDVDPATGTTTIGNNLASIKTDFFGTPLEMGGDAGTPWSLVSPYNGDFSLSVDGRTLDGNFGTWGDPHSGEGLGGKGGRTHWRAGGHPRNRNTLPGPRSILGHRSE